MPSVDDLRRRACAAMMALAVGDYDLADSLFHPAAKWWIIGQGELTREHVRELALVTEGAAVRRGLVISNTVVEGRWVSVEAIGDMELTDGRIYKNRYHHLIEFDGALIIQFREYFDTAYVESFFGAGIYATRQRSGAQAPV